LQFLDLIQEGKHRVDEGRGQIRVAAGATSFHLRDVVDPPGHYARYRRSSAHIRIPVHMIETINKLVRTQRQARARTRPGTYLGRNREAHG